MKVLMTLIVVMGIAILVALALVAYGIVSGLGDKDQPGFGDISYPMPAGCSLAASHVTEDQIVLRFDGPAERDCQRLLFIDPTSGKLRGSLLFPAN